MKHVSLIIVILSFVVISCNNENDIPEQIAPDIVEGGEIVPDSVEGGGDPYLRVSETDFVVHAKSGFVDVPIESNSGWVIKNNSVWIKVSPESGDGDATIRLSWDGNAEADESRSDSVLVSAGNQSKYIKIKQGFPLRISEVKGIIGNSEEGVSDSVLVVFNQPIDVSRIKSNYDLCLSEIKYSKPDSNSVRFTYNCAALGGEYPFTIELQNGDKEDFVVPFYDDYVELEGLLNDFKLSEDEQYCWVTTSLPNKLYCIDIINNSLKSVQDLDFEPGRLAYNPYNGYCYVLPPFGKYLGIFSTRIYVIDPNNGKTIKTIIIEPDEYDHPQYPYIHPRNIVFSPDGLGVVVLKNPGSTGGKWKMIESYNNDKMYYHPYFIQMRADALPHELDNLFLNYKNDIIAAGYRESSFSFIKKDEVENFIVDPKFRSDEYYAGGNNTINRFHKLEDKYYVAAAPGSQCIINVNDDLYSDVLLVESRGATADFSYRPGDHNIVFHQVSIGYNSLFVLDFNKNSVVAMSEMIYDLKNVTSLTDGSMVLMTKVDYNRLTTRFYKFYLDNFFRI